MRFLLFILFSVLAVFGICDDNVSFKWETNNFIIWSSREKQGEDIYKIIEDIKCQSLDRWGLPGKEPLSHRAVINCVPDQETMNKLFKLDNSYSEAKYQSDGKIKSLECWIIHDNQFYHRLPLLVSYLAFCDYEQRHNIKIDYWAKRGMSILNGSPEVIKVWAGSLNKYLLSQQGVYFSETLFTATQNTFSEDQARTLFDIEASLLVLMLRQEFGQYRYLMMIGDSSQQNLYRATGYENYAAFDKAFQRFLFYSSQDMASNKMPVRYLEIHRR